MWTYRIALSIWLAFTPVGMASAMESLDDEDLDRLSAAGDSVVTQAVGGSSAQVAYLDDAVYELDFAVPNAQAGVRALTLQNVVGEVQLLVDLNVLSASQSVASTDQRNFSIQSWGSTLPDPATVQTAAAAPCTAVTGAPSPCGGGAGGTNSGSGAAASSASSAGGTPSISSSTTGNVVQNANAAAAAAPGGSASGGNGGNAPLILKTGDASTSVSNAASASGDVLASAKCLKDNPACVANAAVNNAAQFKLAFTASEAQKDISALFVSNIVGRAQMALNLNIASAQLNLIPGNTSEPFATPFGSAGPGTIKQVNTGIQFRGTPLVGATGITGTFNTSVTGTNQ